MTDDHELNISAYLHTFSPLWMDTRTLAREEAGAHNIELVQSVRDQCAFILSNFEEDYSEPRKTASGPLLPDSKLHSSYNHSLIEKRLELLHISSGEWS